MHTIPEYQTGRTRKNGNSLNCMLVTSQGIIAANQLVPENFLERHKAIMLIMISMQYCTLTTRQPALNSLLSYDVGYLAYTLGF